MVPGVLTGWWSLVVIIILWGSQVPFFYSTSYHHSVRTPGTILFLHEWSSSCKDARYHSFTPRGTGRPYRMMISRGVKEWYLASLQDDDRSWSKRMVPGALQDDDHSWSKRMVPGVLTEWWSLVGRQVPFFYSTSDHHSVRKPGTILLLHEWSSSCKDPRYHSLLHE
jgi:hypothetical protein